MGNVAKTIVIGNLGQDPKLFNSDPNKGAMCVGTLGCDEYYPKRDANGNQLTDPQTGKKLQEKITTWYNFQIYGKRAEAFAQYHKKGDQVYLEGQMRQREYKSNLKAYPCYYADGQPMLAQDGSHFHAMIQVERTDYFLRVEDWKFMKSKRDDNSAYAGVPGNTGMPAAGIPATGMPVPPNMQPNVQATPQNVQAAFTGQPGMPVQPNVPAQGQPANTGVAPQQFTVAPSHLPAGV